MELCHRGQLLDRTPFLTLLQEFSHDSVDFNPLDIKCRHTSDMLVHRSCFVWYLLSYISNELIDSWLIRLFLVRRFCGQHEFDLPIHVADKSLRKKV